MGKLEKILKKSSDANFALCPKKSISTNKNGGVTHLRGRKNILPFAVDTQMGDMVY